MYASLGRLPEFGHHLSVTAESLPFPHPPLSTACPAQLCTLEPLCFLSVTSVPSPLDFLVKWAIQVQKLKSHRATMEV